MFAINKVMKIIDYIGRFTPDLTRSPGKGLCRFGILFGGLSFMVILVFAQSELRPEPVVEGSASASHVDQLVEDIISEIVVLRKAMDVQSTPREPGVQVRKVPLHVHAKMIEVLEKLTRLQRRLKMPVAQVPQIPIKQIESEDVAQLARVVLVQLRLVKSKLNLTESIKETSFVDGMTASDIYEKTWRASYLLDALVGETDPNYVFRNVLYVRSELEQIAEKLAVSLSSTVPASRKGKLPKDVNLEGFKNQHKLVKVERKLSMVAFSVPDFPAGNITPSDVFDTSNMLLAELVRIKVHLKISTPRDDFAVPSGKKPPDVLAQMQLVGFNLNALLGAL